MIPYFFDKFQKQTLLEVNKILKKSYVTKGNASKKFENKFLHFLGYRNDKKYRCLAVSSCTSGLYLILKLLKLKRTDEVIVPSLSFVADANVVKSCGAKVVFADIKSKNNLNISFQDIKKKINKNTKVVIVMHYGGVPCDIEEITKFCKKKSIFLIEDACHALFTDHSNKKLGTFGDASVFSFYGNKNLSTAEGGMIFSKKSIINKLNILSSHGILNDNLKRNKKKQIYYGIKEHSLNFRIDDIRATIGTSELDFIKKKNLQRYILVKNYLKLLEESKLKKYIQIPFENEIRKFNSHHIFPILLPKNITNKYVFKKMIERDIYLSLHYPPIHLMKYYSKKIVLKNIESIHKNLISLPIYPLLSFKNQKIIINNLKEIIMDNKK
jgi:perosamine synthetase